MICMTRASQRVSLARPLLVIPKVSCLGGKTKFRKIAAQTSFSLRREVGARLSALVCFSSPQRRSPPTENARQINWSKQFEEVTPAKKAFPPPLSLSFLFPTERSSSSAAPRVLSGPEIWQAVNVRRPLLFGYAARSRARNGGTHVPMTCPRSRLSRSSVGNARTNINGENRLAWLARRLPDCGVEGASVPAAQSRLITIRSDMGTPTCFFQYRWSQLSLHACDPQGPARRRREGRGRAAECARSTGVAGTAAEMAYPGSRSAAGRKTLGIERHAPSSLPPGTCAGCA